MIQFTLKCANDHHFESWFQSGIAFDKLLASGMVSCSVCGTTDVNKAMMAPRVSTAEKAPSTPAKPKLTEPANPAEQALSEFKKYVEKNSDYVGRDFAKEARAIHSGDAPERPIWGETRGDEAKKLIDDGVPIAPLPFTPTRKSN
ncbi:MULTISPECIES: DUF1178 family protein [Marivita]|uniref:DUF1178 family protein n=1 Tax=Marivita cryptomonadis TaxID=505252 RepID=A0A9Q2NRE7_9RHOB|nr:MULTISPECIES: DUF1178 family protein [Marivita]MCR9166646.1 DUF1178 family protein [Paracoccaceae bacterium]MBM2321312.1 DUF1178 family protein [Marivita cryptomonadis]MBM2330893.1 DUF1178 family protein [Marivita cryptomonadis]MBM2340479.1 DUF1178 family protein [Marivita cryptomonadis]MBM2345141.1 DUF1178 family protein [Marivita cryptomonadis]